MQRKVPRFALSIYSLFMKKEKQGPSCLSNQEHHRLLSLQWEDGQVFLWGAPPDVCVCILTDDGVSLSGPVSCWVPYSLQVRGGCLPGPWKMQTDEPSGLLALLLPPVFWVPTLLLQDHWRPFPGCALPHIPKHTCHSELEV